MEQGGTVQFGSQGIFVYKNLCYDSNTDQPVAYNEQKYQAGTIYCDEGEALPTMKTDTEKMETVFQGTMRVGDKDPEIDKGDCWDKNGDWQARTQAKRNAGQITCSTLLNNTN